MTPDRTIWTVANEAIKHHGELAWFVAAQRADACLDDGWIDGAAVWRRVLYRIEWLTEEATPEKVY